MWYIKFIMFLSYFLLFAYDFTYDRDFLTWLWLLTSILWGIAFLFHEIKNQLKEQTGNIIREIEKRK
jgi:hypothetical protein